MLGTAGFQCIQIQQAFMIHTHNELGAMLALGKQRLMQYNL